MHNSIILLTSIFTCTILANDNTPSDWTSRKSPSVLIKWTTDPNHAFWSNLLLLSQPKHIKRSPATTPPPTPTICSYVPANTDTECAKGCICKTHCASIYFTNLTKPVSRRSQYHVCTNWMLNHASQLRYGLQQAGFTLLDKPTKCGWQRLYGVSALRVGRGSVDVNGTESENWGNKEELEVVRGVMEREYPFIEILVICACTVGPLFSFVGLGFWTSWASRRGKGDRHS